MTAMVTEFFVFYGEVLGGDSWWVKRGKDDSSNIVHGCDREGMVAIYDAKRGESMAQDGNTQLGFVTGKNGYEDASWLSSGSTYLARMVWRWWWAKREWWNSEKLCEAGAKLGDTRQDSTKLGAMLGNTQQAMRTCSGWWKAMGRITMWFDNSILGITCGARQFSASDEDVLRKTQRCSARLNDARWCSAKLILG